MNRYFEITEASNGGWVVFNRQRFNDTRLPASFEAAYSNTEDMLRGLAEMLFPEQDARQGDIMTLSDIVKAGL